MDESAFKTINVIPFIDIMLVLLTIVLTTSTLIAKGVIPISLPEAAMPAGKPLKTLSVDIDRQGTLYFDGRPLPLTTLCASVESSNRQTPILIRADRECALQHFVTLMDALQGMGFSRVSLQTQSP